MRGGAGGGDEASASASASALIGIGFGERGEEEKGRGFFEGRKRISFEGEGRRGKTGGRERGFGRVVNGVEEDCVDLDIAQLHFHGSAASRRTSCGRKKFIFTY